MKFVLPLLAAAVLPASAGAQADSTALRAEHTIASRFPVQERTFTVQLPASYHAHSGYRYPVLYLLDGATNLGYTSSVAGFQADNAGMPEVIIVALHAGATRTRDYLPKGTGAAAGGDAAQFLEYLEKELIPYVDGRYRTAPLRFLSGHSYGGVFVTWAMTERPALFRGYFAQSPALDESIGDALLARVDTLLQRRPDVAAFYHVSMGNEPGFDANFRRLERMLTDRAPASLRWKALNLPRQTHMTTRLLGQYDALEAFFAPDWPLAPETIAAIKAAGVKAHIDSLSARYGYPVLYSAQALAQATQIFLSGRDIASGSATAQLYVGMYPASALAHFFNANARAMQGDRAAAATAIAIAIELYEADPRPELQALYPAMQNLRRQLAAAPR